MEATNSVISFLLLLLSLLAGIFFWRTPDVVRLVAPAYTDVQLSQAVELTRIMLPGIIFGGVMGILVGVNNAHYSFFVPSLVWALANVIVIVSIFFFAPFLGIKSLAFGTLLGTLAQ